MTLELQPPKKRRLWDHGILPYSAAAITYAIRNATVVAYA